MHRIHRFLSVVLPILVLTTLPGCLISSNRSSQISGAYVQPSAIAQVQVNKTTRDEAIDVFGAPSSSVINDDGTETLSWNWTETRDESGSVLLIFAGRSQKNISESVHLRIRDGVVIRKWRD